MTNIEEVKKKFVANKNCRLCIGSGVIKRYETTNKEEKPKYDYCPCFIKCGKKLKDSGFDLKDISMGIKNGKIVFAESTPVKKETVEEVKEVKAEIVE